MASLPLSVGFLATIEGYYKTFVHSIYDTVVEALAANPERKFIAVEIAYFSMWWNDADTSQRLTLRHVCTNKADFMRGLHTIEYSLSRLGNLSSS